MRIDINKLLSLFIVFFAGCGTSIKSSENCISSLTIRSSERVVFYLHDASQVQNYSIVQDRVESAIFLCLHMPVDRLLNECADQISHSMFGVKSMRLKSGSQIVLDGLGIVSENWGVRTASSGKEKTIWFRGQLANSETTLGKSIWVTSNQLLWIYQDIKSPIASDTSLRDTLLSLLPTHFDESSLLDIVQLGDEVTCQVNRQ